MCVGVLGSDINLFQQAAANTKCISVWAAETFLQRKELLIVYYAASVSGHIEQQQAFIHLKLIPTGE